MKIIEQRELIGEIVKSNDTWQDECIKKLTVMYEMAKFICTLDIEEDICTHTGRLGECDNMAYGECEECIIKYFTDKVEKEENNEA